MYKLTTSLAVLATSLVATEVANAGDPGFSRFARRTTNRILRRSVPIRSRFLTARRSHYHVKYHMDGKKKKHFHNHALAHKYVKYLRGLGAHVKMTHDGGHYDVYYHMHGTRTKTYSSHRAAHIFQRRIARLGFHAKVVHH